MPDLAQGITHVDVLVVGAGPAGLVAAHALTQAGSKVRIIDIRPTSVVAGQADGIMPRTIEVFQSYGLAESLFKQANRVNMVAFYNTREEGGISKTQSLPVIDEKTARYPFLLTLNQGAIENIFIDALAERGVFVDRPVHPASLVLSTDEAELQDHSAHPVTAILERLQTAGGDRNSTETVHAKFIIGADGEANWQAQIPGLCVTIYLTLPSSDHVWGAIDFTTTPEVNFPDWRKICTINAANTTLLLIPREQDKLRIYVDLGLEDGLIDPATGRVATQSIDAKKLLEISRIGLQPFVIPPAEIEWWTCYIIGRRVATRFSVNERAFIVGDACHTHSPKAGQGMNVSMNDAHNLAWKLAYVLRGCADMALLKTYEFERRKFAQQLIDFDKWYESGFSAKNRSELLKNKGKSAASIPEAFREFSGLTSGVGIQYEPSIITAASKSPSQQLMIGRRLPPQIVLRAADSTPIEIQDTCPSDTRFKIIIFTGDLNQLSQQNLLTSFARIIAEESSLLSKYGSKVLDFITVMKGTKETVDYLKIPGFLRSNYRKHVPLFYSCFIEGGKVYEAYGICTEGAAVVVRPDGYIAKMTMLDEGDKIIDYFSHFLNF
ncbi:FAD binding domain-containing protein [Irpex rosettiformis]|uniref:FAD binding domain-containing protein n=1 Tax=Irpex rosettiformis TaxID=378272 RepID=A0ACB8UFE4_9APHY|nr:FAD binding domain-containing protein [Irpex rosettiformis]